MSSRPPPPDAVPGWNLEFSNRMKRWYYFDPVAKKSVWEKPEPVESAHGGAASHLPQASSASAHVAEIRTEAEDKKCIVASKSDDVPGKFSHEAMLVSFLLTFSSSPVFLLDVWTVENLMKYVQKQISQLEGSDDMQSFTVPVPPILDTTLRGIMFVVFFRPPGRLSRCITSG